MDTVHEEVRHGLTIKISPDTDPMSPEDWSDDNLFLVAFHNQCWIPGPGPRDKPLFSRADCIAIAEKGMRHVSYHVFGLEAYIHSGVRLALSNEGRFPDRCWDVSQLGLVFVSKKEWKTKDKARKAALGLIESWNDYLCGNVYGYLIEDAAGNEIESCWGFSGDYGKSALAEARAVVDHITRKGVTDQNGQYLMPFMAA